MPGDSSSASCTAASELVAGGALTSVSAALLGTASCAARLYLSCNISVCGLREWSWCVCISCHSETGRVSQQQPHATARRLLALCERQQWQKQCCGVNWGPVCRNGLDQAARTSGMGVKAVLRLPNLNRERQPPKPEAAVACSTKLRQTSVCLGEQDVMCMTVGKLNTERQPPRPEAAAACRNAQSIHVPPHSVLKAMSYACGCPKFGAISRLPQQVPACHPCALQVSLHRAL